MIDRQALFTRHFPRYIKPNPEAPLSVGNGRFCFTADITGLQSLNKEYSICPLTCMSEWGWHNYPNAPRDDSALRLTPFITNGRTVFYATNHEGQEDLFYGLRQNAHKVSLARIGFTNYNGEPHSDALDKTDQTLNIWQGVLYSSFYIDNKPVTVQTLVRPDEDTLCVKAVSTLFRKGNLLVTLTFPYGSHTIGGANFESPELHSTVLINQQNQISDAIRLSRRMDNLCYTVCISLGHGVEYKFNRGHTIAFSSKIDILELSIKFSLDNKQNEKNPDDFETSKTKCIKFWQDYWQKGGVIDLSESKDPRAFELERRIVLSQYLTAIQSQQKYPPAETGLTVNSWYGKFNVEMHCWHSAHFALWNQPSVLEKSLEWYKDILPIACDIAKAQGYKGARWPKLCDPGGYNSPSSIAVLLIWQQPHPIFLAELCRRQNSSLEFLQKYHDVIVQTAEFMCDFVNWDGTRYVLTTFIPAQERFDPKTVLNAGFEVEYFRWGLTISNNWLLAMGLEENPRFGEIAKKLARPIAIDGVYPAHENCSQTFTVYPFNTDHPSMVAMLGLLPGNDIDRETMKATLARILADWDIDSTWGWDFPMLAMTSARLGLRELAVDFLLMDSPKNTYLPNGHNKQGDKSDLPLYLPGNGGMLWAAAMMAAGWDGEDSHAPGFPDNAGFVVKMENLHRYI